MSASSRLVCSFGVPAGELDREVGMDPAEKGPLPLAPRRPLPPPPPNREKERREGNWGELELAVALLDAAASKLLLTWWGERFE